MNSINVQIRRRPSEEPGVQGPIEIVTSTNPATGQPYEVPEFEQVKGQLTTTEQRKLSRAARRGWTTSLPGEILRSADLSWDRWAQAICAAIIERERRNNGGVSYTAGGDEELRAALEQANLFDAANQSILVTGGNLYNIQLVRKLKPKEGALNLLRERVKKAALAECVALKTAAKAEADAVLEQAAEKLSEAEEIKDAAQRQLNSHRLAPWDGAWRWAAGSRELGVSLCVIVTNFQLTSSRALYTWEIPRERRVRIQALAWLRLEADGSYDVDHLRLNNAPCFPHLTTGRGCATPQGLPEKITNEDQAYRFVGAIQRTFMSVNMNSLLCDPGDWFPQIREALPEECRAISEASGDRRIELEAALCQFTKKTPITQELEETWGTEEREAF